MHVCYYYNVMYVSLQCHNCNAGMARAPIWQHCLLEYYEYAMQACKVLVTLWWNSRFHILMYVPVTEWSTWWCQSIYLRYLLRSLEECWPPWLVLDMPLAFSLACAQTLAFLCSPLAGEWPTLFKLCQDSHLLLESGGCHWHPGKGYQGKEGIRWGEGGIHMTVLHGHYVGRGKVKEGVR